MDLELVPSLHDGTWTWLQTFGIHYTNIAPSFILTPDRIQNKQNICLKFRCKIFTFVESWKTSKYLKNGKIFISIWNLHFHLNFKSNIIWNGMNFSFLISRSHQKIYGFGCIVCKAYIFNNSNLLCYKNYFCQKILIVCKKLLTSAKLKESLRLYFLKLHMCVYLRTNFNCLA